MTQSLPISLKAIKQATERLAGRAVRTPMLESSPLNACYGGRALIKPEVLQHTGPFQFHGAFNSLASLTDAERQRGVLAFSSGNHAQGVAYAAHLLGVQATIVMPIDAAETKIQRPQEYGAEVVQCDRYNDDREATAARLASESAAVTVNPFDDPFVMAGQGIAGLEIAEQASGPIEALLTPCGGGGLVAGTGTTLKARYPAIEIHLVEPLEFDDTARSIVLGERVSILPDARSICDALQSPTPGKLSFAVNRHNLTDGLSVSDAEAHQAMAFAFKYLKLVVEPGGAVALAGLLSGKPKLKGRTAAVVLSGGNVDPAGFIQCLGS